MKTVMDRIKAEPVMFQALVQAAIAMLVAFGLHLTVEQTGTIMAFTAAVLAFITRSQVTPNHVVAHNVQVALNTPVPPKE